MIETQDSLTETKREEKKRGLFFWFPLLLTLLTILLIVLAGVALLLNAAPKNFEQNTVISVEAGEGVKQITTRLEDASVVRSNSFLYLVIAFLFEAENIKASTYVFEKPLTTYEVARQLTLGDFDSDLLRFTHIEGERVTHIASRANELLPNFDENKFLELALPLEGRLFPDTYFIPETYTAEELVDLMSGTFDKEISSLQTSIAGSNLSLNEIIVLASIIEREANSPDSMKMVSGILQNRMEIDMPLQADASIEYILDKPLEQLTPDDLKIDSPYNSYLNLGLPPTAIGNPGLTAIKAVLEPTKSDYFYYITDKDGVFHYARTYREHQKNIELYLR